MSDVDTNGIHLLFHHFFAADHSLENLESYGKLEVFYLHHCLIYRNVLILLCSEDNGSSQTRQKKSNHAFYKYLFHYGFSEHFFVKTFQFYLSLWHNETLDRGFLYGNISQLF